ncbi:MAG: hypothetical protein ACD_47C00227G0003 [uncultured bacterium]|nr:MAG: hypothetical protein ACD_47C00227G0003 [uncultured bacterium]
MLKTILSELRSHAPFTLFGVITGVLIMLFCSRLPYETSYAVFYTLHPVHVLMSALVTAAMYELHECPRVGANCMKAKCNFWKLIIIGYAGSVGIATLSDSLIPYFFEALMGMPNKGIHLGFIEKWWLVNPLALLGIVIAHNWRHTKFPHAMHVLLSTWASLFHVIMAVGGPVSTASYVIIAIALFAAVWLPCCVSDIVFPLLFIKENAGEGASPSAPE